MKALYEHGFPVPQVGTWACTCCSMHAHVAMLSHLPIPQHHHQRSACLHICMLSNTVDCYLTASHANVHDHVLLSLLPAGH